MHHRVGPYVSYQTSRGVSTGADWTAMGLKRLDGRMEMLAEMEKELTSVIADKQGCLGDLVGDITSAERARTACGLMQTVLRSIDSGSGTSVSTSGVTPLMSP